MASETETGTFLNYILSDGEQIFSEDKSHILCNVIIQGTYKKEFNYLKLQNYGYIISNVYQLEI